MMILSGGLASSRNRLFLVTGFDRPRAATFTGTWESDMHRRRLLLGDRPRDLSGYSTHSTARPAPPAISKAANAMMISRPNSHPPTTVAIPALTSVFDTVPR